MSAVEGDAEKPSGEQVEELNLAECDTIPETCVWSQTPVTGKNNLHVFKNKRRQSVIAEKITKSIPMDSLKYSEINPLVEDTPGIGGVPSISTCYSDQHDSVLKGSGSPEDYNVCSITGGTSDKVEAVRDFDKMDGTAYVKVDELQGLHKEKSTPLLESFQNFPLDVTGGIRVNGENNINPSSRRERNPQPMGKYELNFSQNPLEYGNKDIDSVISFQTLVDDNYSNNIPKSRDIKSEKVNLPIEHSQMFTASVEQSSNFTIPTLPPSEIPSELHPFLKDFVPVKGEFVNIPGTSLTAVVPHGYSHHYCFSRTNSSLVNNLEPRQINNSASGSLYTSQSQSQPNWPTQSSSQAANQSQLLQPSPPFLKLNSDDFNSITVTPLEPIVINSRVSQPRRFIPTAPKTRSRLKSVSSGRTRGSRPHNLTNSLKLSAHQISTMVSKIPPKLSLFNTKENQECDNDTSMSKKSIGEFHNANLEELLQTYPEERRENEMSSNIKIGQTGLIDEEKLMGLAQISKTSYKSPFGQRNMKKPLFECMVCNKKYSREDYFSKHIKKCMNLHGVAGRSYQQSMGSISSSSEASPPQKVKEIEICSNDNILNVVSNKNYSCESENGDMHASHPKNTDKKKIVPKVRKKSSRFPSESEQDSFLSHGYSSNLETAHIQILTPDLTSSELEDQSPLTDTNQALEQLSARETRSDVEGKADDPWMEEIMEIAAQEGIFIPALEPMIEDQQLMDAVSSIL